MYLGQKMKEIPKRWRNVAKSIERVREGEEISVEVEGGYVIAKVPANGYIVHTRNAQEIYFPDEMIEAERSTGKPEST